MSRPSSLLSTLSRSSIRSNANAIATKSNGNVTKPITMTHKSSTVQTIASRQFASDAFVPKPVYSSFKLFKTKTAIDISPIRAQLGWNSAEKKYLSLKRAGGFRITFAAGENKQYDWENSALITLSVSELGDILAFAADKSQADHKIYHDPQLGSEQAGQTRKELVVKRIGNGKPGYFFNFSVTDQQQPQPRKWSIAVTEGEMQVFVALIQQTLPNLLALSSKPYIMSLPGMEGQ